LKICGTCSFQRQWFKEGLQVVLQAAKKLCLTFELRAKYIGIENFFFCLFNSDTESKGFS